MYVKNITALQQSHAFGFKNITCNDVINRKLQQFLYIFRPIRRKQVSLSLSTLIYLKQLGLGKYHCMYIHKFGLQQNLWNLIEFVGVCSFLSIVVNSTPQCGRNPPVYLNIQPVMPEIKGECHISMISDSHLAKQK